MNPSSAWTTHHHPVNPERQTPSEQMPALCRVIELQKQETRISWYTEKKQWILAKSLSDPFVRLKECPRRRNYVSWNPICKLIGNSTWAAHRSVFFFFSSRVLCLQYLFVSQGQSLQSSKCPFREATNTVAWQCEWETIPWKRCFRASIQPSIERTEEMLSNTAAGESSVWRGGWGVTFRSITRGRWGLRRGEERSDWIPSFETINSLQMVIESKALQVDRGWDCHVRPLSLNLQNTDEYF